MKRIFDPAFQYVGLSVLCLLTFGFFNTELLAYCCEWRAFVLVLVTIVLVGSARARMHGFAVDGLSLVALLYATAILATALLHEIAFLSLPGRHPLNSVGHTVAMWRTRNLDFTLHYLFLPMAFLFHREILAKCKASFVLKVLCGLSMVSAGVVFFQAFLAPSFLHKFTQGRYGGLATDLNAFALSSLWIVPISLLGMVREERRGWRLFFLASLLTVGAASAYTGTRTAFAGLVLVAILLAIGLGVVSKRRWARAFFLSFACIAGAAIVLSPPLVRFLSQRTSVAAFNRLDGSFVAVNEVGFRGWWNGDPRSTQFKLGWALFQRAPLAGWGPGGFYREVSNEAYRQTGMAEDIPDSALNHYLMIAGDLGLPVLLLSLLLLGAPLFLALVSVRAPQLDPRLKLERLIVALTGAVFMLVIFFQPPAYFPDTLWVWTAMLALAVQGREAQARPVSEWLRRPAVFGGACLLFILLATGGFRAAFGSMGYEARVRSAAWPMRDNYGMYAWESGADGDFRWLSANAGMIIRPTSDIIELDLRSQSYNADPLGRLTVAISVDDRFDEQVHLRGPWKHHVTLYVPSATGRAVRLKLAVPRTFNLAKMGIAPDDRDLGVMMGPIKYGRGHGKVSHFAVESRR